MFILVPILTFVGTFLVVFNIQPAEDSRRLILWSATLSGIYAVLVVEFLTLFQAVTKTFLIVAWAIPLPFICYYLLRQVRHGKKISLPRVGKPANMAEYGLLIGIIAILLLTALVAWKSPPQTWDSLNYHMSRVAHWAQQQGLQHFATGIEVQNNMAPGAEILVLHTYLLNTSDDWVNFVQWLAMIGSAIGVTWIAKQLGGERGSQLFSVVCLVTIPVAIAEATSTMTDYVLSFWILVAVAESLEIFQGKFSQMGIFTLGASAGLAFLTKPTSVAFLIPLAVIVAWSTVRANQLGKKLRVITLGLVIFLLLNLGYLVRNTSTYGNPIGPENRFDQHANQLRSLRGLASNLIRNVAMHMQTPSPYVNKAIAIGVRRAHELMDLDLNDPRTTAAGRFKVSLPSTNEILVGNPLHAVMILASFGVILWRRKGLSSQIIIYAALLIASALLFSFLFKWLIFGSRLQLPFFVLAAPLIGFLLGDFRNQTWGYILGYILLLSSLPWVLSIDSRPIVPREGHSVVGSVLTESRTDLLFANGEYLKEPTRDVVVRISESGCTEVGLMLAGNGVEYTFWSMSGSPRTKIHFEWIVGGTPSANLASREFEPCAIICENCRSVEDDLRGLQLVHSREPYSLYLGEAGQN